MIPRPLAALVAGVAGLVCAGVPAVAAPGLEVGVSDDVFLLEPGYAWPVAASVGLDAVRVTLQWAPGQTAPAAADAARLATATTGSGGRRLILAVFGQNDSAPQDEPAREAFCAFTSAALAANPTIRDVILWNEPNKQAFWKPQFAADGTSLAPAAYAALLARCFDVLHAAHANVNVIGLATAPRGLDNPFGSAVISHSVGSFIRGIGSWYRASGRTAPLFDTVSHHSYPLTPSERPWRRHTGLFLGQGDWDKLMNALEEAFAGTAQPLPGQCAGSRCVEIWFTEGGFQTSIDAANSGLYTGAETEAQTVPDEDGGEPDAPPPSADSAAPDQATQLRDAIRLAACQDHVGAYLSFLLHDEPSLAGWQSAPFWVDRTAKDSLGAFSAAAAEARAGAVDCSALKGGPEPDAAFTASADPLAGPLAVAVADGSTGGAATTWRWDVLADGKVEAGTQTATLNLPGPGVHPVRLLVRNGVGEDAVTRLVGAPVAATPGLCASETAVGRTLEVRYGVLSLPTGASAALLRASEALPAAVAGRVAQLVPDPAFAADIAAATATAGPEWATLPDEQADAGAALLAAFSAAGQGLAGTLQAAAPAAATVETVELGGTATARGDGTTDCLIARAALTLVRQDATLVPPPPVATLGRVEVLAGAKAGPQVRAAVACGGYPSQRCLGALRLDATIDGRPLRLGRTALAVAGGAGSSAVVRLGKAGRRALTRAGTLRGVRVRFEPDEGTVARRSAKLRLVARRGPRAV